MKDNLLLETLKINKNLIIPHYVLKSLNKLDLNLEEFILLIYLINQSENVSFDINKLSSELSFESNKILELVSSLNEKNLISIEMSKNNEVIEEFICLDLFYNKLHMLLTENLKEEESSTIFNVFENEFGRTLSPTELGIINNWRESQISDELIVEALKEAVLSGVHNMRYIDKILFEWSKKGYKNPKDIKRKNVVKETAVEEIYDYDWLNE